jgi:hypothetical protein
MKNSPLTTILLAVLTASALVSVWLCWSCISRDRELRQLRTAVAGIENNRRLAQALAAEGLEYSKKNSAIDPILEAAGVKSKAAGSTNKPPTK